MHLITVRENASQSYCLGAFNDTGLVRLVSMLENCVSIQSYYVSPNDENKIFDFSTYSLKKISFMPIS
jgi:hypothetical protein